MDKKLTTCALILAATSLPLTSLANVNKASSFPQFSEQTLNLTKFGDYAVGAKVIFARDKSLRFDPWNSAYASQEYRDLLRQIEASGQPRTVATHVWYPAKPTDETLQINQRLRSPVKAMAGKQARFSDYVLNDPYAFEPLTLSLNTSLHHIATDDGKRLTDLSEVKLRRALPALVKSFVEQPRGAFLNAPVADGKFPMVILSHGLGGNYAMWDRAGEFLASHGYVVVAPTYISDGTVPLVFHDPASEFAASNKPKQVGDAYKVLAEMKVLPNFLSYAFGIENPTQDTLNSFEPSELTIVPGGLDKVTDMQRNLFRQRVADLSIVKETLATLNLDKAQCQQIAQGSILESCGDFSGKLDMQNVGVSGHSLGSMTSQLALQHVPGIRTAIGLNNGVPYSWAPLEMMGADSDKNGVPLGNTKPLLQLIGDEDDFVQMVFYSIFQQAVIAAGGDASKVLQLPAERAVISKRNPQPVALSAYQRAQSDKMIVTINDVDHGVLTQHDAEFNFPNYLTQNGKASFSYLIQRNRKATGEDLMNPNFVGEAFYLLSWEQSDDGKWYYKPHVVRDYYYLNWFDYYLKDDKSAKQNLLVSPFENTLPIVSDIK